MIPIRMIRENKPTYDDAVYSLRSGCISSSMEDS
jgi:hypothetical protein